MLHPDISYLIHANDTKFFISFKFRTILQILTTDMILNDIITTVLPVISLLTSLDTSQYSQNSIRLTLWLISLPHNAAGRHEGCFQA